MALPDTITKATFVSRTTGISSQTINSGSGYLGNEIDNAANGDDVMNIEVVYSYSTAPTANKTAELYILYSYDGTNYEEGNATTAPLPQARLIRAWSPPANTNVHRFFVFDYPIASKKFKLLVRNVDTGQAMTVTINAETAKYAQIVE